MDYKSDTITHAPNGSPGHGTYWPGAVLRAFHPARWGLSLAGLIFSYLVGAWTLALCAGVSLEPDWWRQPMPTLSAVMGNSSGTVVFRGAALAVELALVWGLIGGWIARSEVLRQRPAEEPGQLTEGCRTSATQLVLGKKTSLLAPILVLVIFVGLLLLPALAAGLLNRALGLGVGAVLAAAVLLPLVVFAMLLAALAALGSLSFTIMPATIATEGSDAFDALSRGYSYFFNRPFSFAFWWGLSLAVSSLPLAAGYFWLGKDPEAVGPAAGALIWLLGAALSLSCFWSLQPLVYLKIRRIVDDTPEDEIWDEPLGEENQREHPALQKTVISEPARAEEPDLKLIQEPEPASEQKHEQAESVSATLEPVQPTRTSFTLRDTLKTSRRGLFIKTWALFLGILYPAAALAAGAWVVCHLAGQDPTPAGVRAALLQLAGDRPLLLLVLAAGAIVVGSLGLGTRLKMVARMTAVESVFEKSLSPYAAWCFARQARSLRRGSVLLATAGIELYLATCFLVPLAFRGASPWSEPALGAGLAVALLGLGALGIGAVAVEGQGPEETRSGSLWLFIDNGGMTSASAAANLFLGLGHFARFLLPYTLAWWLTCASLSWWGGDQVQWIRWGLDGALIPSTEGGLYQVASWIAGAWFFFFFAFILIDPIRHALHWGIVCYFAARQRSEGVLLRHFELSAEERADFDPKKKKKTLRDYLAKYQPQ